MQLFQLLTSLDNEITPQRCKLHLACWNGREDPLDVYLAGRFDDWQAWQGKRNFERKFVVSLIAMPGSDRWLFAGTHDSDGSKWHSGNQCYRYKLRRRSQTDELDGRLVVKFKRPGRQSYLLGDRWINLLEIAEIRPEKLRVAEFPGYSRALLSKQHLDIIVRQQVESWKVALSAISGIYVIADRATGKLYVGSATAGEGIWSRWCSYSVTGHGGNRELVRLLKEKGDAYADNFQFGILEIVDTHASQEDILTRESYWKDLLQSRTHGYNAN